MCAVASTTVVMMLVGRAHLGERRERREQRPRQAPEVRARRMPAGHAQRRQRCVTDGDVIAVAVAAVGGDDDVGPEGVDASGEHAPPRPACRRPRATPAQGHRRRPSRSSREPRRRPRPGSRLPPGVRPRAPRPAASSRCRSPARRALHAWRRSPRASTPQAAAWASTEPSPNVSSSGWATVISSCSGRRTVSIVVSPSSPGRDRTQCCNLQYSNDSRHCPGQYVKMAMWRNRTAR